MKIVLDSFKNLFYIQSTLNVNMITIHDKPCVQHVTKRLVQRGELASLRNVNYSRKIDGELATATFRSGVQGQGGVEAVLACENMVSMRSGGFYTESDRLNFDRYGSWLAVWDILSVNGVSVGNEPLRLRLAQLAALAPLFKPSDRLFMVETSQNPDFVAKCFDSGAEGVCAKDLDSGYGSMLAAKVGGVWTCRVSSVGATQSVGIVDAVTGQIRGNVSLFGGKVDRVRVGSWIRIEGLGLTRDGKIREPKPAREWLVLP